MNAPRSEPSPTEESKSSNFLRQIIERDLAQGINAGRPYAGTPGDAAHHAGGAPDAARIRTRFPPEPNGYLHIGHAKSITLNFGLAADYGGVCHLRFDDTNPEKEEQEYVDGIIDSVRWLGYGWEASHAGRPTSHLYYASNYFDFMYRAAEALVESGLAYVDEQSPEQMRAARGDFNTPGTDSPFRDRSPADNLQRLREMRDGRHADGAMVLRAKIDMASPNINLRDPAIYRIKHAEHHNTGTRWCIYPMYTFAHPIEDALEHVTHSICTLEFEDQRPFYDWLLDRLCDLGLLDRPRPHQYEFARLNVTYVVTSKRKLRQLVEQGIVSGWDDPRMPTLVGLRRRGYTPESIRAAVRTRRHQQGRRLDRPCQPRRRAARRPRRQGTARDGRARPVATGADQLGRGLRRRGHRSCAARRRIRSGRNSACAASSSAPNCGSSATTSPPSRRRASSASSPATRCA